jgi:uncharacterized membrane protein
MQPSEREKKSILNLYALLGTMVILSVLPYGAAAILSLIFLIAVLVLAYSARSKSPMDSFAYAHASFIVSTVWISGLIALVTTILSGLFMLGGIDYGAFEPCANALANKGMEWLESASYQDTYALIDPCLQSFMSANKTLLIGATFAAAAPPILYLGYRLIKGVRAAMDGRLVATKGWL